VTTEDTLANALTRRGHKLTRPRRAVLRVLAEAGATLTPAEIHRRARRHYDQTGLVTVYRTLDLLAACGAVRKVHAPDGCHSFAPASAGHAHHVVCENCRSVVEFDICDLEALVGAVQRRTGYAISGHWLELFGRCPNCREA
jgi:Fe2+ or Zn2+ uptake regulation protein